MKKILLIDDDETYQRMIQILAEYKGVKADKCSDPMDAISMISLNDYDAIFVDQRLPRMPGTDLVRMINESHPKIPVYIVTNFPSDYIKHRAENIKVQEIINKHDFVERLSEVISV